MITAFTVRINHVNAIIHAMSYFEFYFLVEEVALHQNLQPPQCPYKLENVQTLFDFAFAFFKQPSHEFLIFPATA